MLTDEQEKVLVEYIELLEATIEVFKKLTTHDSFYYESVVHGAMDLRRMADNLDNNTGYATMDASIMRHIASHLDQLPVELSHDEMLNRLSSRSVYKFKE